MQANERQLIETLFERLRAVEGQPRDPEVERLIADELRRTPHAVYAMAQTIVMQNQALETAAARIEAQEPGESVAEPTMRGAMGAPAFGRRGSVPAFGGERDMGRQGGGFLAGAGQVAMGVAGGMLMAEAARSLFGSGSEAQAATGGTETAAADAADPAQDAAAGDAGSDAEAGAGDEGGGGLLGWLFGGGEGGAGDNGGDWGGDGGDSGGGE